MANPSIVNATAVGKEVIRRSYIDGMAETEATIVTGVANHVMTIVSIIFAERGGLADSTFSLYVDGDLAGTNIYLGEAIACGAAGVFVWSDRFAITATDKLHAFGASASGTASYDVWCTYIDQQFAAP
tara:strand:- start:609 stop:992 length:384 start_codon:yes stop_codon:yes gene_type:complete